MQNFLAKIKAFNNKHRKIAPFLIWIEIVIIFLASVIKNILAIVQKSMKS